MSQERRHPSQPALIVDPMDFRMSVNERRGDDHEARLRLHADRLSDGESRFTGLEGKMDNVTEKVDRLASVLVWVGGAIGLGVLTTSGTALVWVIGHMQKGSP